MRKYLIALLCLAFLLVVATFVTLWYSPANFAAIMPAVVFYFTAITAAQHYLVVRSARQSPRTFIKVFLGLTVGTLFLHLIVMVTYMFTHLSAEQAHNARLFLITFCICYIAFLIFETVALVLTVRKEKK